MLSGLIISQYLLPPKVLGSPWRLNLALPGTGFGEFKTACWLLLKTTPRLKPRRINLPVGIDPDGA